MSEKQCRLCQTIKPLSDFPKRSSSKDGRRTECCDCTKMLKKEWVSKNNEKIKMYTLNYKTKNPEKAKASFRAASKKLREKNSEKRKENYRLWYLNNKDKARAASRSWALRNPLWFKEYISKNKEKLKEKSNLWTQKNRGLVREKTRRYQAAKRGATPPWLTSIQMAQIQEMYDIAVALEVQTGIKHHVDHIHPLQGKTVCGLHVPWNLQILVNKENISKSNKLVGEM